MQQYRTLSAMECFLKAQTNALRKGKAEVPAVKHGKHVPTHFITFSRQAGSKEIPITDKLAELLNSRDGQTSQVPWTVFDRNLVQAVMDLEQYPPEMLKFLEEDRAPQIGNIIKELFGFSPSSHQLVRKTSRAILQLATMGHVILVGRAANLITRKLPGGLHIRLVGSPESRIGFLMEYRNEKRDSARNYMEETDQSRKKYLDKYFNADIDDPLIYDLVLRTDHFDAPGAASLIMEALDKKRRCGGLVK